VIVVLTAGILFGGEKKSPVRSGENDVVEITATPLADRESVKQALGSDLGGHYILMDVRLVPKEGRKVAIHWDDFLLKTDKDGERTTPFAPSQIAGRGALVVSTGGASGGTQVGPSGPTFGGSDVPGETRATMKSGAKDKPDPLLDVLRQKILPEKDTEAPVSGLLYFPMEKQKLKDLELWYTTPEGKLILRFK
jgi:hypothetical protein